MIIWIKDGNIVDPHSGTEKRQDIVVNKGRIERLIPHGRFIPSADIHVKVINASGMKQLLPDARLLLLVDLLQ